MSHVLPPPLYRLDETHAHVERILRNYDEALRLRKSVSVPGYYVLERKVRVLLPVDTALRDGSDEQLAAADGYIHITHVHPSFLSKPSRMLEELKRNDMWAQGGATKVADAIEDEERYAAEKRRENRREDLRAIAAEAFPVLDRIGGIGGTERMRFNNPGLPSPAGDPALSGGTDHASQRDSAETGQQDSGLHDQRGS